MCGDDWSVCCISTAFRHAYYCKSVMCVNNNKVNKTNNNNSINQPHIIPSHSFQCKRLHLSTLPAFIANNSQHINLHLNTQTIDQHYMSILTAKVVLFTVQHKNTYTRIRMHSSSFYNRFIWKSWWCQFDVERVMRSSHVK